VKPALMQRERGARADEHEAAAMSRRGRLGAPAGKPERALGVRELIGIAAHELRERFLRRRDVRTRALDVGARGGRALARRACAS
jgi:hypothetical protein